MRLINFILSVVCFVAVIFAIYDLTNPITPTTLLILYFFPSLMAIANQRYSQGAIFVLNLFLGWTGWCWVAALVWSLAGEKK